MGETTAVLATKPKKSRINRPWLVEFWHYRELFFFLVWRDVKIRYKQTVLGATWAVILGDEELRERRAGLKNLRTQQQEQVPWHQLEKRLAP